MSRPRDIGRFGYLFFSLLVGVAVAAGSYFWSDWVADGFTGVSQATRANVYLALAATSAALLAFIITALTILLSLGNHNWVKGLRQGGAFRRLVTLFHHTSYLLLAATLLPIVGLVLDRSEDAHCAFILVLTALEVAAYTMVAISLWALGNVVHLAERDGLESGSPVGRPSSPTSERPARDQGV